MLRSAASPDTRGVRPVWDGVSGLLNDNAPGRPPFFQACFTEAARGRIALKNHVQMQRAPLRTPSRQTAMARSYLIFASRNSTCFLATGSYFFMTRFSVMGREV